VYIFVVLVFAGAWVLFLAPKRISEREKEQLNRILSSIQTAGKEEDSIGITGWPFARLVNVQSQKIQAKSTPPVPDIQPMLGDDDMISFQ
jgi:hypothetical protein